uniref:Uncharacterized protein n=1 Tax=Magallana gigas TaxID=29159 RepID=A0A8W8MXC9_MAGGI
MDELAVTELAKDGLHQTLRELVVPQRPTTLDQLREQAILAEDAVDLKRSTSNQIPSADSQTKGTVDTALVAAIQAAMMNIMPATVSQHRQDEEVNAVYSPHPHQQRSSRNQWPRRRSPCLRCGDVNQPLDDVSDDEDDHQLQQDPIHTQPLPDSNTDTPTDAQENTPNLAPPQTADTPNIPDSQTFLVHLKARASSSFDCLPNTHGCITIPSS